MATVAPIAPVEGIEVMRKFVRNEFIYRKARKECEGKSDDWIKQGINEVLNSLTEYLNMNDRTPNEEHLTRIESVLEALKDELEERKKV